MNRQLTMLIVDDMEVERISFAEIFKDEYQILEAENGKQAMEQLEQQKVHIVLLDLCMPVMDGFEVIREMKQQEKYADIPIVAKTAIDELREKGIKAGLFRPITIRPLAVKPLRAAVGRAKQILFTESANGQLAQMVLEKLYGLNTPYETLFKMGVGVTGDDIVSKVEGMLCKV